MVFRAARANIAEILAVLLACAVEPHLPCNSALHSAPKGLSAGPFLHREGAPL